MSSIKFIDFFAGIGGFRLGMERNGHKCVGFCEIDKFARQTYKANFDTEGEWECHDIRTADPFGMPDADCYCFGFPCQAFSVAGRRGGFEDTRGTLFFEVMRLAKVRKPKYLFAENVLGLLSHNTILSYGLIHAMLLTDLFDWRSIWEENRYSQKENYSLSNVIMNFYIQEILGLKLGKQNLKLEVMLKTILDIVTEKTEQGQKDGLTGNYKYWLIQAKLSMRNLNSCQEETKMLLEQKLNETDTFLNLLNSIENLKQMDTFMLEKMAGTIADAEKLLKICLAENLNQKKLCIMLTEKKLTIDQKTCLFALQELNILICIILDSFYSVNLLNEVSFGLIERRENINYVKTFGVIVGYITALGYDCQWQVLNSKDFGVPQNRERVFIVGNLRGTMRPEVFPFTGTNEQTIKQIIGGSQGYRVYDTGGVSVTLASQAGGMGAKTGLYLINQTKFDNAEISNTSMTLRGGQNIVSGRTSLIPCTITTNGLTNIGREYNRTLMARDYKGVSREGIGGVIIGNKTGFNSRP